MKNISKVLAAATAILFSAAATEASAQATATASATATIVTPISLSKTADMNFGNVAVGANAGTVVLAPAGTRTATSGVTLPAVPGTVTAGAFTVQGQASYTYAITLPLAASTLTHTSSSATMSVGTWTSSPAATGTLGSNGSQALTVGGTLSVAGSQAAGVYTTGTDFAVTVNYN